MSVQTPEHAPVETATTPRAPWVVGLCALAAVAAGTVALNRIVPGEKAPTADVAAVQMDAATFSPAAVTVARGASVEFRDLDDGEPHFLSNGQWDGMSITPATGRAGAPVLDELEVDGGTITVGPFAQAGVFPIYCSIHPGMNLEVQVT